jgi:hypothetical protein
MFFNKITGIFCISILIASAYSMTAADKEEYEKLGLSQVEWEMIQNAHISKNKLYHLLKCGISIPEYFKSPWIELDMSENEWLTKRCRGLSTSDMRTSNRPAPETTRPPYDEWAPIRSFFLPGVTQIVRRQKLKGWTMAGIAVLSAGACASYSLSSKTFQPLPLAFLVPDMLLSAIDIGIQVKKEHNPDADRFTNNKIYNQVTFNVTFNFK